MSRLTRSERCFQGLKPQHSQVRSCSRDQHGAVKNNCPHFLVFATKMQWRHTNRAPMTLPTVQCKEHDSSADCSPLGPSVSEGTSNHRAWGVYFVTSKHHSQIEHYTINGGQSGRTAWIYREHTRSNGIFVLPHVLELFNLLAPELFFFNFSTPVYKMRIMQEPNMLELWNKLHFEEEKNGECIPRLKYSVPILLNKYIKCNV